MAARLVLNHQMHVKGVLPALHKLLRQDPGVASAIIPFPRKEHRINKPLFAMDVVGPTPDGHRVIARSNG